MNDRTDQPLRGLRWSIRQPGLTGTERCQLHQDPDGWQLTGAVVARLDRQPLDCAYRIRTTPDWATRSVAIALDWNRSLRHLHLDRDHHDRWTIDGCRAPELDGCIDVDLGITPSTNTLPIRRLDLAAGQTADIDVAWVDVPSLTVRRSRQTYTRRSQRTWTYRAGTHTYHLTVDNDGLVTTYGHGLWQQNHRAENPEPLSARPDLTSACPDRPSPGGAPC